MYTPTASAKDNKITTAQRSDLIRDLNAEYGTAKVQLPRSKKPLQLFTSGQVRVQQWSDAMYRFGPAARVGDLVQITKVEFADKKLILEINFGLKGGRKWWHRIQVGGGMGRGTTLGSSQSTHAPGGTKLALVFEDSIVNQTAAEIKELLNPILDFEKRTATEHYLDSIDEKYKEAIEKKEIIEGMDKEMVLLARGIPTRKLREFNDGIETEDWIYGEPPGELLFVTFMDGDVIRVKSSVAAIGGWVKETIPIER